MRLPLARKVHTRRHIRVWMVGRSVAPVQGGVGREVGASRPVVGGGPGRLGLDGQAGRRRGRGVQEEAGVARSRRPLGVEVVH